MVFENLRVKKAMVKTSGLKITFNPISLMHNPWSQYWLHCRSKLMVGQKSELKEKRFFRKILLWCVEKLPVVNILVYFTWWTLNFQQLVKKRKELILKQNFKIIFTEVVTAFSKLLQGTMNFTVVKIQTDSCESKYGRSLFKILPQKLALKIHMLTNCF